MGLQSRTDAHRHTIQLLERRREAGNDLVLMYRGNWIDENSVDPEQL